MSSAKSLVTIKGTKEGLLFILDDEAPLSDVIRELVYKLEHENGHFFTGPLVHVHVKTGKRKATDDVKKTLKEAFSLRGNLVVQSIEHDPDEALAALASSGLKTFTGLIRSGQTLHHDGSLLFIGDVNPGGTISSSGNILILGALRGLAHAGTDGDQEAIIAASFLKPTQLRIANVVSRPPEEWGFDEAFMEFAYLREGVMEIEKLNRLHRIRPQLGKSKGV